MKSYYLFCLVLSFITCCVFTWKAESSMGEMVGFAALVISVLGIGKMIISKLNT